MPTSYTEQRHYEMGTSCTPNKKIPFKLTTDKLPPEDNSVLLIWEKEWGYEVIFSRLVYQHVLNDLKTLGKPRITHWLMLEKEKGDVDETEENSKKTAGKKGKGKGIVVLKRKRAKR